MKLHFQRFEFKYWLSWREFYEIRGQLRRYVSLDGFARHAAEGFYEVISLYYDSPKFYCYHEKTDGAKERKKIRLRAYRAAGAWVGNVFFEIKRKYDAVILKDRFLLGPEAYDYFLKNNSFKSSDFNNDKNAQKIIAEYEQEHYCRSLGPQILVGYKREPYLGKYNKNFRVTFDYNIWARESRELLGTESNQPNRNVLSGGVIMEIKFNGRLPYYIREIIEQYNLERLPFSKYCRSLEACYVFLDFNFSRNYLFTVDKNLLANIN